MKTTSIKAVKPTTSKLNISTDIFSLEQNTIHQNLLNFLDYEHYRDDFPAPAVFSCF